MLPDFPGVKQEMDKLLNAYFARAVRQRCPGFDEIPRHRLFEGKRDAITREREEIEETKMLEAAADMTISNDEIARFDFKSMKAKMDDAAEKMAEQMTRHFYQTLSDACEKSGQVSKGGPFTADSVLAALDMIAIDFDPVDDTPHLPSIHIAPSQFEALRAALEKLATDPEYQKKHQELLQKKYGEWLDREASRKLAG